MHRIQIDQPTKSALEYVEKLRGSFNQKRQKLNKVTTALRPSDFPDISTQQLCDILIRFTYNGTYIDETFRDHIMDLVVDRSLSWDQVVKSITDPKTKTNRLYTKCLQCDLIRRVVPFIQIKSFDDSAHADTLLSTLKPTVFFLTELILELLADEDALDTMQIDNEDPFRAYQKPLEALNTLIHDDLCGSLLSVDNPSELTEQLEYCLDAFVNLKQKDKNASSLMESLFEKHVENCKVAKFEYIPEGYTLFNLKHPSIKMLISIFACFKYRESSKSMADTIQTFAEIMRLPGEDVIFDVIHASLLLKCEETMTTLHQPKQHRVDFRWQSTTFFYKRLPQIIGCLIEGGKITADHVRAGLSKAMNDLTMMFDTADVSWQNASFLTLLNELEPFVGKDFTDPLRQRRREHMRTTANLTALAETDKTLIENTDIDTLLTAVKEVMNLQFGQNEEFWRLFLDKIYKGDCDGFDAITSILIAEGKIIDTGIAYSAELWRSQNPSETMSAEQRIRLFDEIFLLLSRIVIRNPSLPIGVFMNGGPGNRKAERVIFYKWAMWFVKRVPRKHENKGEHDLESLRKEVEMLVQLANEEVGIAFEEEEVEEIVEPINAEPEEIDREKIVEETAKTGNEEREEETKIKVNDEEILRDPKIENPEQPENPTAEEEIEKMDTSEALVESTEDEQKPTEPTDPQVLSEVVAPAEIPKEETVENTKPVELPPVTWNEVHYPLPRITKKTGRVYLAQLKEGRPFWRNDDQNLNLASVVAAIPTIGKLLVEEHEEKQGHRIDKKAAEEHMTNILHAIDSMPCLFVCLVQWLDCEEESPARTSLAAAIKSSLDKRISSLTASSSECLPKWKFVQSTVKQIIDELTGKLFAFPEITLTLFSASRRFCPFVTRNEKPDFVKLKHAWHYMQQQSWASPHALRLLEHANIAGEFTSWRHIYINKTLKSLCGDLMKNSVDMIFTFLMMDEYNSLIRIHENLMDFWLSEDTTLCHVDGRFEPGAMRAVIRLMTHVMLMTEWALDRLVNEGPPLPDPLPFVEPIESPEPEDLEFREKWVFLLRSALERTINRFFKILRNGLLFTVVNIIIQLIRSIAGTADCKAKSLLVKRISPTLIFQLSYIEPASVSYELMNVFCDPANPEHTRTKIMFLCALRRGKIA